MAEAPVLKEDLERCFALHRFEIGGERRPFISFSHSGTHTRNMVKSETVKFMCVGALGPNKDRIKNHSLVVDCAENIRRDASAGPFKIAVVGFNEGSRKTTREVADAFPDCFDFHGTLTYPQMYDVMRGSDFIISALDPENPGHRDQYLRHVCSGPFAQSVGFQIPLVVNEEFAKTYGFDERTAVLYKGNDLEKAMRRAIAMPPDEYTRMCAALGEMKTAHQRESLENMERVFGKANDN